MSNITPTLDALLADPLLVARAAARDGARVIGYLGNDVPVALILAANALPVRLRGLAGKPTPNADRFLESSFTPESRAIAEQWITGELDFLAAVVLPRTDDAAQRLYYYLCELQRRGVCAGPKPVLYDVANIGRESSLAYTRESTRRLIAELDADTAALPAATRRVAARETLLADLRRRRLASPPIAGSDAWRLAGAAGSDWRESFDATLAASTAALGATPVARRVLLAGDAPPDDAIHRAVEAAGGTIVREIVESENAPAEPATEVVALADQFHARRTPVVAMREREDHVAACAREARADAVLCWLIEEDESLPWEIARQVRRVRDANIPVLLLSRQRWMADEATLQRIREFVERPEVAQ